LNDGRGKTLASETVSAHNPDFAPKVHPDEVVASDPQNERYFKVWGKPLLAAAQSGTPAGTSPNDGEAVKHLGQIAEKLIDRADKQGDRKESSIDSKLIELWSQTAQQRDTLAEKLQSKGSDQLTTVREVLGLVRELQRNSAPEQPPQQKSALDTVKEVSEIMTAVRQLTPESGPTGTGEGWMGLVQSLAPSLGPAVGQMLQLFVMRMMTPQPQGAPDPNRVVPPGASMAGAPAPAPARPSPTAAPGTIPNPAQAAPGTPVPDEMLAVFSAMGIPQNVVETLMQIGKKGLDAFQRGVPGDEFAHAICILEPAGEDSYDALHSFGKEMLLNLVTQIPGVEIPRTPELERWFDQFFSYGADEENGKPTNTEAEAVGASAV
jgi:hypothetical protein